MIEFAAKKDIFRFLNADKTFHMSLTNLYNNTQLYAIMDNIRNLIAIIGERALSRPGRFTEVISEHRLIIDALNRKNFKAAVQAMSDHITATEQAVLYLY